MFGIDSYVWYADNNSGPVEGEHPSGFSLWNSFNPPRLNNPSAWPEWKEGVDQGQYAKKIRLISAYLKLMYVGRADDRQGMIRVSMGYKIFASPLAAMAINDNDL